MRFKKNPVNDIVQIFLSKLNTRKEPPATGNNEFPRNRRFSYIIIITAKKGVIIKIRMVEYSASSIKGRGRYENQDRIMVDNIVLYEGSLEGSGEKALSAVVCDGVGGTKGGAEAAETVALGFKNFDVQSASPFSVNKQLHYLNRVIVNNQNRDGHIYKMATTTAGLFLYENKYLMFNLGDTHIYEVKKDSICLKTVDHTVRKERADNEVVREIKNPDALTKYLGGSGRACNPTVSIGRIMEDEVYFIICSDGVYKAVDDETVFEIIKSTKTLSEKRKSILNLSIQNGSVDDKSLVVIKHSAF